MYFFKFEILMIVTASCEESGTVGSHKANSFDSCHGITTGISDMKSEITCLV